MRVTAFLFLILALTNSASASFQYAKFNSELQSLNVSDLKGAQELDAKRKYLIDLLEENPNNPWLWYALGDLEWKYIATLKTKNMKDQDGEVSSVTPIDQYALSNQKSISFEKYEKAYYAHIKGSPKLKTKMLLKLYNTATNVDLKVSVHRTILAENPSEYGIFGPNNTKIEFRRGLVAALIKAKEYELALEELDKVEAEYPDDKNNIEWRKAFEELIDSGVASW